ncbi:murein L,D-transpeptidase YcbB/YkuD [Bradyrhizobium sp. USDA 4341]
MYSVRVSFSCLLIGITGALAGLVSPSISHATEGPAPIVEALRTAAASKTCGRHEAALAGTLERLGKMSIPLDGKLVLVNIAARTLAAYDNGEPAMESRVVIGREGWKTPDLSTTVDYVRVNPTWTVPESIIKANGWRAKLRSNPGWFSRNGFDVAVGGKTMDPRDGASLAGAATFIQRPGPENALGRLKVGLANSGGIYLHDTNDPDAYERKGVESHGCIRVEGINELAGWMLGKDKSEVRDLIESGDQANRKPAAPIRVVVGYFTAWPDSAGQVHYYRDFYHRDPLPAPCDAPDGIETPYGNEDGASTAPAGDNQWPSE